MNLNLILEKAYRGERLDKQEGTGLFSADLLVLGAIADKRRKKFHPEDIVTFIIDRNITFTNVCYCQCEFCAFYVTPNSPEAFILSNQEVLDKIEELVSIEGTQVMLQGGLHPQLSLDYYTTLLRDIKSHYPQIYLHSLSVPEIYHLAKKTRLSIKQILLELKSAGLDSLPGAAEILVDRVRQIISPNKISTQQWLDGMEVAHSIGMETTATMTFGIIETFEERIEHILRVRELQDKTGGFRAFIPWTFSPRRTKLSHLEMAGGIDYLKTVAISRIMLDNLKNIHAGWVTEGPKLAQVALSFGANDFGGILMEEKVVDATGVRYQTSVDELVRLIKDTRKIPAQRNSQYELLRKFN
ncbi:MAG: cyclic dehypoxanthinyl futalosine synthase [bacterium]|nr:cyclic dehypoxanthinyl futalosine synthase [bacterium]